MSSPTPGEGPEPSKSPGEEPSADSVSGFSMSELEMPPLTEASWDEEPEQARAEPVDPELLARRRHFRTWVTRGMLGLALFTLIAVVASARATTRTRSEAPVAVAARPAPASSTSAATFTPTVAPPVAPPAEAPNPVVAAVPTPAPAAESIRDIKLPPSADHAGLAHWSSLARSATPDEFATVDVQLAALVKSRASSIRERSRLARAVLWRERGRGAEVEPVLEDLARHAKSPAVRAAARSNQTH